MITFDIINLNHFNDIKKLLSQLTIIGDVKEKDFLTFIKNLPYNHMIYMILYENNIAGMGTIIIENKIIHNFGKVCHIEDIVIDNKFRGLGLGKELINFLAMKGKSFGCYKIILDCNDKMVGFYNKCGFKREGNMMTIRF
tara:strand:- start:900 stop:1319 length:420 start_codon:yes stop_codon:yes gene_type:complete